MSVYVCIFVCLYVCVCVYVRCEEPWSVRRYSGQVLHRRVIRRARRHHLQNVLLTLHVLHLLQADHVVEREDLEGVEPG